jgi:hypothetical protein
MSLRYDPADLLALPSDCRLVRVGRDKTPLAGRGWFDADNYTPDEAATLNGTAPPAWGVKTGPISGQLVLDLDAPGWRESIEEVTGHPISDLPRTIAWTSGKPDRSGHLFMVPEEWWPHLANRRPFTRPWREGDPLGEGGKKSPVTVWELRWDRHQSVVMGAHPETGRYRWLPDRSPHDISDPAVAPDWLLQALLVQEHPEAPVVVPTTEDADRAVAMLEHIDPVAHSSYSEWLRVGMALHHTNPGLLAAWVEWSRQMPNFDEAECLAKWDGFGKGHKGRPATIATLHHLAQAGGYREPKRQQLGPGEVFRDEAAAAMASEPIGSTAAAEQLATYLANITANLPLGEVLPPRLAHQLTDRAEAFPCDPVALLGPLLAVAASIVGTRGRIQVKEGWSEPLIIWAGNVLPPSALKSPTAAVLSGPLMELQKAEFQAHSTPFQDESADGDAASHEKPKPRRFLISDCTYEQMVELMAQPNTPGLLSYFDELGQWFALLERTNSGQARGGWLSSWTGGVSLVDRKTSTSSFAEKTAISLFGNIQPERLADLIAEGGDDPTKAGDGLWCRFLWCRPSEVPWRYVEHAVDIEAELVSLLKTLDSVGPDAFTLKLDQGAIALARPAWEAWAIQAQDSDPARAAFLGKLRGYSVRLAGILHLLRLAELAQGAGVPLSSAIKHREGGSRFDILGADPMARGLKTAGFYLQQFDALQPEVGGGDLQADVAGFLRRVEGRELQEVAPRDVQQWKLLGKRTTAKEALELLERVVSLGYGHMTEGPRRDSPGRWVRSKC